MDPNITAAIIAGGCTIIGGIAGAIIGKSDLLDKLFRRNDVPSFVGTRWESKWTEKEDNKVIEWKEYFEFTRQNGNRVYGIITSDLYPDMKWELEGIYNNRFLRLFWTPSKNSSNKFFQDYGCYFFEVKGKGSFSGYAVGYDSRSDKVEIGEHLLTQI